MYAQGKLQASTAECVQVKAKLKAAEQRAQAQEHKWQTNLLAEQRQVQDPFQVFGWPGGLSAACAACLQA